MSKVYFWRAFWRITSLTSNSIFLFEAPTDLFREFSPWFILSFRKYWLFLDIESVFSPFALTMGSRINLILSAALVDAGRLLLSGLFSPTSVLNLGEDKLLSSRNLVGTTLCTLSNFTDDLVDISRDFASVSFLSLDTSWLSSSVFCLNGPNSSTEVYSSFDLSSNIGVYFVWFVVFFYVLLNLQFVIHKQLTSNIACILRSCYIGCYIPAELRISKLSEAC